MTNEKFLKWWILKRQRGMEFNIRPHTWVTETIGTQTHCGNRTAILRTPRRRYTSFIGLTQRNPDHRVSWAYRTDQKVDRKVDIDKQIV